MVEKQNVELKLIHMEDVVSKEVEWLWYPYIPYGKITIIEGDPGEGKTTLVLKLAAALSRGLPLPCDDDKEYEPIHIIYQTAEDGIEDTIKPRLEKAGADCSMIRVIDETDKELSMTDDRLEQAIIETKARLIILDPIQAYIGATVDMHRANEIRPVLKHLGIIAEKHNCAIILIGHMNKASGSKSTYRGLGSIDIQATARSVLLVARLRDKPNIRIMAHDKSSLAPAGDAIGFEMTEDHKEFDEALEEYNKKQTRPDRRIEDYFEHVAGKEQDMAVEIIIQIGDREFWKQYDDMKSYMKLSYQIMLDELRKRLPQFVVANAVVHLDEDSPHMHIVGVPMADGYKKGLSKQVSKRKVFTKEVLSRVLQDELREVANKEVNDWFGEQIKEKSKGRNYDLTVAEYKVAQETEHLEQIQEQVNDADIKLFASQIAYKELERSQTKELNEKRSELQSVRQEIASVTDKANEAVELLDKINTFISSFRLFAPAIEEYANHVEADKTIEAGNSFRGILYEIGKLLETFKKLIKEGLCWFPRLMRWKTSKGEVAPVFIEKSNGYSYSVYGYMNVDTKEYYSKELMQREIKAGNRTGTVEQMDANVEAMARDLQEILRIGAEQKRLWEVYKGR